MFYCPAEYLSLTIITKGNFLSIARKATSMSAQSLPRRTRIAFAVHTYLGKLPSSVGILAAYAKGLPP